MAFYVASPSNRPARQLRLAGACWAGAVGARCGSGSAGSPPSGCALLRSCWSRPSGLSGSMATRLFPVLSSAGRVREAVAHSGFLPWSSQLRNTQPITQIRNPRAAPKKKPRVRSRAPIRESRMRSEIFTVMIETTIRVTMKIAPMAATSASVSLWMYCLAKGRATGCRYHAAAAAAAQATMASTSRVKPRTAANRAEITTTPITTRSRTEKGMRVRALRATDESPRIRAGSRLGCIAATNARVTLVERRQRRGPAASEDAWPASFGLAREASPFPALQHRFAARAFRRDAGDEVGDVTQRRRRERRALAGFGSRRRTDRTGETELRR